MEFSTRLTNLAPTSVRKLSGYAEAAASQGKKVYHLNIGQPDLFPPAGYFEQIKNFQPQPLDYMPSLGTPALRAAIQSYYRTCGVELQPAHIAVTAGGAEAIQFAFLALTNPGDELIIFEPFYSNYKTFFSVCGVNCVPVTTSAESGYHYRKEDLLARITEKTKAIVAISPGNPTGAVLSLGEMREIADIALEKDLFIIADEVYREFVYDGLSPASFGQFQDIEQRLVIVDSVSKRFNACGARIGALITKNKELMAIVTKLCQGRLSVSTVEQHAALSLYGAPAPYLDQAKEEFRKRRDAICRALDAIPGVVYAKPEGAFYVMCRLPVGNATDFLIYLLSEFHINRETVMLAPGDGFYETEGAGLDEVRIACVLSQPELEKAMAILAAGLSEYQKIKLNK